MKTAILATFFVLVVILQNAAAFRNRNSKRMIKRRCDNLCRAYSRTVEIRMMDGGALTKPELSTILEQTIKRISYSAETYVGVFREHMNDIHEYLEDGNEVKRMCHQLKICKALFKNGGKKIVEEKRTFNKEKSCSICKSVVTIVKASLNVMNNTLENTGGVVKMACNMFMTRSEELKRCLSIVDRVGKFNSQIFQKIEAVDICTIFGFCGNSSFGLASSCQEHMKGLSPWGTAFSLMREGSTLLMSKGKSSGDILKNLKQEELFSTIGKCISDMEETAESSPKRTRRSVDTTPCPLCEKIEKKLSMAIKGKTSEYDGKMQEVCDSLPLGSRYVCRPIAALVRSFHDVGAAVIPGDFCRRIACPAGVASNRTCEMCQKIQTIAKKQLTYFSRIVDAVIDQVDQLCGLVGSPAVEKECQKVGKITHKVSAQIVAMLEKENFCKDFLLC